MAPESRYRAIMTDTDREYLSGEGDPSDSQLNQSRYRVRQRIEKEVPRDMAVLRDHQPKLLDELREAVCTDGEHALEAGDRRKTPFGYIEITNTGIVTGSSEEFDRRYGRMDTPPWYKRDDEGEE